MPVVLVISLKRHGYRLKSLARVTLAEAGIVTAVARAPHGRFFGSIVARGAYVERKASQMTHEHYYAIRDSDASGSEDEVPLLPYDTFEARSLLGALDARRVPPSLRSLADPVNGLLRVTIRDSRSLQVLRKSMVLAHVEDEALSATRRGCWVGQQLEPAKKAQLAILSRAWAIEKHRKLERTALDLCPRQHQAGRTPPPPRMCPIHSYRSVASFKEDLERGDGDGQVLSHVREPLPPRPPDLAVLEARACGPGPGRALSLMTRCCSEVEGPCATRIAEAIAHEVLAQRLRREHEYVR